MDAEWNIIYDKLAKCRASGAKVVLSRLAIVDLATQYFADHDIFCAGRVRQQGGNLIAHWGDGGLACTVDCLLCGALLSCHRRGTRCLSSVPIQTIALEGSGVCW